MTLKIRLNPEMYPSSLNPCFAALPKGAGNPAVPGKLLNYDPVLKISNMPDPHSEDNFPYDRDCLRSVAGNTQVNRHLGEVRMIFRAVALCIRYADGADVLQKISAIIFKRLNSND